MKEKDLRILSYLRCNARMSLTDMSRKSGIAVSTLFDRLKNFDKGLIIRHVSLIDFDHMGYKTRAKVLISVPRELKNLVKDYLIKHENVNSLFKVNSNYDFVFEVVFRDVPEVGGFLDLLEGKFKILNKEIHYISEDLKREGFGRFPVIDI